MNAALVVHRRPVVEIGATPSAQLTVL